MPSRKSPATCAGSPLAALAERIRPYVRRTDVVEVDEPTAVVVVAHGADEEGARAAFQRLREVLATAPHAGDDSFAITFGHATCVTLDEGEAALSQRIREAGKPRVMLRVALAAEANAVEAAGVASENIRVRSPKTTRRPRALVSIDTSAAALAVKRSPQRSHLRLLASASKMEQVDENLRARAHTLGVPFVQLPSCLPSSCRGAIAPDLARELNAVAIGRSRSMLTVAMHDPRDAIAVLRLRSATGLAIFPVLAAPEELKRALLQLPGA